MMDTFRPLHVAKNALGVEDGNYFKSWIEAGGAGFNPPTS
jgi:homogentisate 1,2-dioxygenase